MGNNLFLKAMGSHDTLTENGAVSNSSTGKAIIDQFGSAGNFRNREYAEVCRDQEALWRENPLLALRFPFYLRMITRKVKINNGFITEKVQNGQGARDESFKRLLWIAENHKEEFYNNIWVLPIIGSWKDLWQIMYYDIELNISTLNRNIIFTLMQQGMACEEHVDLILKYMPRIKSVSKLKTSWTETTNDLAKEFAKFLGLSYKEYNKLKAKGKAHEFQKNICARMYDKINWNVIPGRALNKLINGKFLENHNLVDCYTEWIKTQPIAKFSGYVYELGREVNKHREYNGKLNMPEYKKYTINKQFQSLIEKAQADGTIKENVWSILDTSGSMGVQLNCGVSAMDVCMSLGMFFSTLNKGAFHKNVMMFDNKSTVKQLSGEFTDMMTQVPMNAMGGTNFQSVVDEICRVRNERPEIPLEEYPTTLLVVSDMQFNDIGRYWDMENSRFVTKKTNFEELKDKLYTCFPREFVDSMKFIWWNVRGNTTDFPARMDDGGCYMFSGFDGSIVSMLLNEEQKPKDGKVQKTMEEMVNEALSQEILLQVNLSEGN